MAAGNTYVAIKTETLASAQASVTFSSISGAYTDLVLIGYISGVSVATGAGIQFNSDTGNNYSMTGLAGNGTAASSFRQSSVAYIRFSYEGTYRTTNQGIFKINLMNYSNATTYKTTISRNDVSTDGTEAEVGLWRNTAAITSIDILPTNGAYTFSTGSTFTLYGIAAA